MILGRDTHVHAACFDEIDEAVSALSDGGWRKVCFNAHEYADDAPDGSVIWNMENVPEQVSVRQAMSWRTDHEVWDFSARSAAMYGAKHVPIGYHPSMERFTRKPPHERDIDVVFAGCVNYRRFQVLKAMHDAGLRVCQVPGDVYGPERDLYFARAKLALNVKYRPEGTFEQLRCAHLVANRVPVLNEEQPDMDESVWGIGQCPYDKLVENAKKLVNVYPEENDEMAQEDYEMFRAHRLVLP